MSAPPGRLARAAGHVALITAAARVIGFVRWLVFAATVGAAGVGTVYQTVNTVPNVVYEVAAGGVLAAVVVPLVARATAATTARSDASASDIASALLTRTMVVLVPLTVALALAAGAISDWFLGSLGVPGAVDLGTRLLVLFAPQLLLYGLGIVVSGVLQAHDRFVAAATAPLLSSLVMIATYVLYWVLTDAAATPSSLVTGDPVGWWVLGLGTTAGVAMMSLPLLVVSARAGIILRPRWALPRPVKARAARLAGAGLLALVAQQICVLVVLTVANRAGGDGALVAFQYAQAVYLLPYAVLAVPVATAAFPTLARVDSDPERAHRTLSVALRTVLLVMGAGAAALIVAAVPIGHVFAGLDRTAGGSAIDALPRGLAAMAPGLVGFGVAAVLTRALYAQGRASRVGLWVGAGWLIAAALPLVLVAGRPGPNLTLSVLGGAMSVGMTVAAVGLAVTLAREWGSAVWAKSGPILGVVMAMLVVSAAVALTAAGWWPESLPAAVVTGAIAAVATAGIVVGAGVTIDPVLRTRLMRRPA